MALLSIRNRVREGGVLVYTTPPNFPPPILHIHFANAELSETGRNDHGIAQFHLVLLSFNLAMLSFQIAKITMALLSSR